MKVLIVLALATLTAAQPGADLDQVFSTLDTDNDHKLTLDEMMVYFKQADHNGDGQVTFQEYAHDIPTDQRHQPEVRGPFNYYDKLDNSKDNLLQASVVSLMFNKLDANKDSKVSLHEFLTGMVQVEAGIQSEIDALKSPVGR